MKNEGLLSEIVALLVIVGAFIKIFHLPYQEYGSTIYKTGFILSYIFLSIENYKLNKKIKEIKN